MEFPKGDTLSPISLKVGGGGGFDTIIMNGLNQKWGTKSSAHSSELVLAGNIKINFLSICMMS